jgi:methionyl-tRNA formyltransferase
MPSSHSIIFCGTPAFAVPALRALAEDAEFNVTLVVTQPDRPMGRKAELRAPDVKVEAESLKIPVFQPENVNEELLPYLEREGITPPDFLVVVAYGKILKKPILELPRIAPINVHGSLLPRWRGASPVEHAILAGDDETGITVQVMAEELDAGDTLSMEKVAIGSRETALDLRKKLSEFGAGLLRETLKKPLAPRPQPAEGVTFCRKLTKEDGRADAETMTAIEIDRRVRALNPWPGTICTVEGMELKLLETSLEPKTGTVPLPCAKDSTLYLVTVQQAGGKPMPAETWMRGRRSA